MKITKARLKEIIKEEIAKLATEAGHASSLEHMTPGERFVHDNGLPSTGLAELIDSLDLRPVELAQLKRDLDDVKTKTADPADQAKRLADFIDPEG